MSNLPIWAQDRAREFWRTHECELHEEYFDIDCLAALLVEVSTASTLIAIDVERDRVLAEVRRVVEEQECTPPAAATNVHEQGFWSAAVATFRYEILSRLDKPDTLQGGGK